MAEHTVIPPRPIFSFRDGWKDCIPARLRDKDHWVLWRYELNEKKTKWTKVPYKVHKPSSKASTTDPQDWDSFHEAVRIYEHLRDSIHKADGIGYVFSHEGGLVGIDFDNCIKDGVVLTWALDYIDRIGPTYIEVSPSGAGLKLVAAGALPGGGTKVAGLGPDGAGAIEIYDVARYFTITGHTPSWGCAEVKDRSEVIAAIYRELKPARSNGRAEPAGAPVAEDDVLLAKAKGAKNGAKFKALFEDGELPKHDHSQADYALCCRLAFWWNRDPVAIDRVFRRSALYRAEKWDSPRGETTYGAITIAKAIDQVEDVYAPPSREEKEESLEGDGDPHRIARVVAAAPPVAPVKYRGDYFLYARTHWDTAPDFKAEILVREVKAEMDRCATEALEGWERAKVAIALAEKHGEPSDPLGPKPKAIRVTRTLIADVEQALGSEVTAGRRDEPPFWREPKDGDPDPLKVLPVRNGLLDLSGPAPVLRAHTPRFFSPFCLPFDYDPNAPPPVLWQKLLHGQWGADLAIPGSEDDLEAIETIEEQLGYLLLPDNSLQRIFLWIGPTKSGKGTLREIFTALIGERNIVPTSPAALASDFGLQPLLGKTVAFMGDARTSEVADSATMMDRLLRISGNDPIEVNRKNKEILDNVRLKVRFNILSNELPNFRDQSGAIVARYTIIRFVRTIPLADRDPDLAAKIIAHELPGILNLAIAGLYRLRERRSFRQPKSAANLIQNADEIASPLKTYVEARCHLGPDLWEEKMPLFKDWCDYAEKRRIASGSDSIFGKNLFAACPGIHAGKRGPKGGQVPVYLGIRLKPDL